MGIIGTATCFNTSKHKYKLIDANETSQQMPPIRAYQPSGF